MNSDDQIILRRKIYSKLVDETKAAHTSFTILYGNIYIIKELSARQNVFLSGICCVAFFKLLINSPLFVIKWSKG